MDPWDELNYGGGKKGLILPNVNITIYIYISVIYIYIYTYIHVYITNVWDGGDINYKCRYFISYGTDEIKILSIADRHLLSLGVFHRLLDVHLVSLKNETVIGREGIELGFYECRY